MHLAEANVHQAEANLKSMKSKFEQTKRDWERVQRLAPTKAVSQVDIDTSKNGFETATAAVAGCEAAVEAAKRSVEVNRTALDTAQINLNSIARSRLPSKA
jgi:multidrug resistance efflux pump